MDHFSWAASQEGAREGVRYAIPGSGQAEATLDASTKLVVEQYSFGAAKASNISAALPAITERAPDALQNGKPKITESICKICNV